jgi:hypothetical protein
MKTGIASPRISSREIEYLVILANAGIQCFREVYAA